MTARAAIVLALALCAGAAAAQEMTEKSLPLTGSMAPDGSAVMLDWFDTDRARVGSVAVDRRLLGEKGAVNWRPLAHDLGITMRFTDDTTAPGIAYEYRVTRSGREIIDLGYWIAGTDIPPVIARGRAYVIVDDTLAADLAPRLDRLEADLTGDGWQVFRHRAPRDARGNALPDLEAAVGIRQWLQARHAEAPSVPHAILLVGHLPLVFSGRASPDGHAVEPHATDLFYGDIDGVWRITPEGQLIDNRLPSDFIEMQVGRIDFAQVADGSRATEIDLLRAYLDKNHHWRMGLLGDLRDGYGRRGHLDTDLFALRNVVGPDGIATGGHHDLGEAGPWLWGVDFGDWNGRAYLSDYRIQTVFALNFGSGKQKIDVPFNQMVGTLAQPFYTLAVGWGARPAWWLHLMALGGSIGEVHMATVNNGRAALPYAETMDYYPTGLYLYRNPVWVNLLGDPTLRAFPLAPPADLQITESAGGWDLTWSPSPDPDVLSYRVDRIEDGVPVPVEGATALTATSVTLPAGGDYLLRAVGRKVVPAGSFFATSQGLRARPGASPPAAPDIAVTVAPGGTVTLPARLGGAAEDGTISAIIAPPDLGRLDRVEGAWRYTAPEDAVGSVSFPYSVRGAGGTTVGRVVVTFTD